VLLTTKKGALVIPAAVVQRGPKGTFAYAVGPDHKAVMKPITIDSTEGDVAIVAEGLSEGEQVVVDGQYQLRPGSAIAAREGGGNATPKPERPGGGGTPAGSARGTK
jgi:multidrug efflux system membrane fusion protein